eukprot:442814-Pleurochrysis_carterae.AAC.1
MAVIGGASAEALIDTSQRTCALWEEIRRDCLAKKKLSRHDDSKARQHRIRDCHIHTKHALRHGASYFRGQPAILSSVPQFPTPIPSSSNPLLPSSSNPSNLFTTFAVSPHHSLDWR